MQDKALSLESQLQLRIFLDVIKRASRAQILGILEDFHEQLILKEVILDRIDDEAKTKGLTIEQQFRHNNYCRFLVSRETYELVPVASTLFEKILIQDQTNKNRIMEALGI